MLVCVSGDGGELLQQDVLTQRGQRHVLPHVQTDRADLEEAGTGDRGQGSGIEEGQETEDRDKDRVRVRQSEGSSVVMRD